LPLLGSARSIGVWLLIMLPLVSSCGSTETMTAPAQIRCSVQAQAENLSFTFDGGTGTLRVTTNRECTWSAQSEAPWVTLTPPMKGQGDGTVQFTVAANGLPLSRATAITVEDQRLQISQTGRPCGFRLSSTLETVEAAGGDRTVQVSTTSAQCHWTASSDVPWISITSGREGDDTGAVTFHVDPLAGPQRTGTLTLAGQVVQVQQGAGCSYSVGTNALDFGAAGGASEVAVSTPAGCSWTAESGVPWITLTSGAMGSGPGVVALRVAATDGPARTGTVTVAGRIVTVTQSPGCSFTVDPLTYAAPAAASTSATTVRAAPGCAWTAAASSDWIVITAGQNGNGTGEVRFSVGGNTGPARVGGIRIAGQTMTVNQASGCAVNVNPTSVSVGAAASTSTIQVTSAAGCSWSAASGATWIAIGESSGSGNGNGQVLFSVAANSGPARQGTLSIGGHTVTVMQANGCTYTATPPSQDVAATGGTGAASISTGSGCPWNASSSADWITVGATSGTGPAQVPLIVAPNNGPPRTGTISVASTVLTVNQGSPCEWVFMPPDTRFGPDGGNGNVLVIVTGACTWTAASDVDWITLTSGASGIGNGLVQFVAAPNPGPARTGTVTIAGRRYEVNEAGR
jgi:Putative binding domain, N-terminal/Viral BACON domain